MAVRMKVAALAAVVAAAVPAVALAAGAPAKGSVYHSKTVGVVVSKSGKSVEFVTTYCHKVGPVIIPKIALEPGTFWHFSFTGKVKHVKVAVTGLFATSMKVKGDMKVGSCAKKAFTVTRG